MKREPYIIKDNLSAQEIEALISRAYNEGYQDGKAEFVHVDFEKIASPTYPYTTPAPAIIPVRDDWNINKITCDVNKNTNLRVDK